MKVLFIGDVFGEPGIQALEKHLQKIINREHIDFVIAQGENVSGRKGLVPEDYYRLKKAGVSAFTMGNHVWAKEEIEQIINNEDIIRPYNIEKGFPGSGSRVFKVKGKTLRVTSMLGLEFNELRTGWDNTRAKNFFDAFDELKKKDKEDFHLLDFHAEVTSEKAVFGLYADGKVSAFVGTHTHIQTNDAHILPKGTAFITDVGMTGPVDAAIGADYEMVYQKMRYGGKVRFDVSKNKVKLNAVLLSFNKTDNQIKLISKDLR